MVGGTEKTIQVKRDEQRNPKAIYVRTARRNKARSLK